MSDCNLCKNFYSDINTDWAECLQNCDDAYCNSDLICPEFNLIDQGDQDG